MRELRTPLAEADVRSLALGEEIALTGTVWGLRDLTLIEWERRGFAFPADLGGAVLLHTQPNLRPRPGGGWEPTCVGTTTSQRMDRFTRPLLERLGIRAIIGKGGLSADSAAAMAEHGCVYLAVIGGAASVTTLQVEEIEAVHWEHLLPEALFKFRVRGLAPLFTAIDARGGNLIEDVERRARQRLEAMAAGRAPAQPRP